MTYLDAIAIRKSRRTYLGKPLEEETLKRLQAIADNYNREGEIHIQLVKDGSEAFNGLTKSYGLFKGVRSLIALVGDKRDPFLKEKLGYYGEFLILEATTMELGTCWVGGSFDHSYPIVPLADNEVLDCVITIGYVSGETYKEKLIHNIVSSRRKPLEELYTSDKKLPDWIFNGLKAVQKAPSASNRQPVRLKYFDDTLTMYVTLKASFELFDLGIAKSHFVLTTGCGFEWGNGGKIIA
jgi:nitroreductase